MSVREGHAVGDKLINDWRPDIGIAKRADRIETLLVGAVPQDIRTHGFLSQGVRCRVQ
jgi:hypothetical protein